MNYGSSQTITAAERARRLGWLCYGLQAAGCGLYIIALWGQVFIDTKKANTVAVDSFYESHRHWRLRTTLLFLLWTILGGLTIPFGIGWLVVVPAVIWYLGRVAVGMFWYARARPIGVVGRTWRQRRGHVGESSTVLDSMYEG